jgi:fructosamine-3-kinase
MRMIGGQHGVAHFRTELGTGCAAFVKLSALAAGQEQAPSAALAPAGERSLGAGPGFAAEASGLRWLAAADAVPVPEVLAVADDVLALSWIPTGYPDQAASRRFGAELARLHAAGADGFGAPWPGVIAGLPLPNSGSADDPVMNPGQEGEGGWGPWYAAARLLPYVRIARDAGALTAAEAGLVEAAAARVAEAGGSGVAGPDEPPSRIHGDCWSGNVLWSDGRGWLVDPAAHGGHRETDLAMLDLFGAPYLADIRAAYQEVSPLAPGWQARVPLHQLHPLLVHVCLFGASYTGSALAAARAVLAG